MLLLGLSPMAPVPFGHVVPALLLALAYLEADGAALPVALVAALASLALTAAAVWDGGNHRLARPGDALGRATAGAEANAGF